ncbi:ABC transporter substrate-binding protein [Kitasatospora sp. NBC_01287]|uniref:ABC transporter substrate-binding protein n=1 Tax=Kitasatospora sp. NBC_01287 TaxID=2903573 RepID=UPI00224E40C3|nr:ABC transporter substrate-binding protein [Kitasatospora sp. NBC_01287]MCX4751619.1 ABC transporter substrate-binding protein [Kitasatospora sp. NBC_01287]
MDSATWFRGHRGPAAAAGIAALLLGALSGCSAGAGGAGATPAAGPPRAGGTLRLAVATQPDCLDPHQSPTQAARLFARPILDSLVYQDAKGALHPWLATSWQVSPDGLTYTLHLRDSVTFTDGTPFDAAAVVANLDQVVAPATKSMLAAGLLASYASSRAVDPHTVEITLRSPDSGLLGALATPNLGIESPKTLTAPPATLCTRIVGTGPFRSDTGFVSQKGITYTRNPGYAWAPAALSPGGPAHLDGIELTVVPDDSTRGGALTSGQVDAATALSPIGLRTVRDTPGLTLHDSPYPGANYSYWPNTASGPLADLSVRQAVREGIDWSTIVQGLFFGLYPSAKGPLSTTTPGYDSSVAGSYRTDVADANKLLDQAGWTGRDAQGYRTKDGVRLSLRHLWSNPSIQDLAVQIQGQAKALGIEIVEQNVDSGTYVKRLLAGDYDLIDTSFAAPDPDVLRVLFSAANIPTAARGISNNVSRYDNPAVEQLFKTADQAATEADREHAYDQVQQRITQDAAVFPIYSPLSSLAARSAVQGVTFDVDGTPDFYGAWLAS